MRAPSFLEALVASGLIVQAVAQAPDYGNIPGQSSRDGLPGGDSNESSDGAANSPSCIREGTTTIFVTVAPTAPASPSGDADSGSDIGSGTGEESGETVYVTLDPTTTVFFSDGSSVAPTDGPALSDGTSQQTFVTDGSPSASESTANSPATATDVRPFTTITIDIWGTGGGSESNDPAATASNPNTETSDPNAESSSASSESSPDSDSDSDSASAPQYTSSGQSSGDSSSPGGSSSDGSSPEGSSSDSSSPADSSEGNGSEESDADAEPSGDNSQVSFTITFGGPSGFTYDSAPSATTYGSLDNSALEPGNVITSTTIGSEESPWYTVVTDVNVNWVTGSNGPSQVTAFSAHTLTFAGGPTDSPSASSGGNHNPSRYTIVGPDGRTTVLIGSEGGLGSNLPIETSAVLPNQGDQNLPPWSSALASPSPQPTNFPDGSYPSDLTQATGDYGAGQTTYTSYTLIGEDGLPTVIQYTWTLPQEGPSSTDSVILPGSRATDGVLTDLPRITIPGPVPTDITGSGSDSDSTTCLVFTFTGSDGLPTVTDSTIIIGPTDSPSQIGGGFSLPGNGPVPTYTTFTMIGPDGLPTIVESPLPSSPVDLPTGSPSNIGSTGGLPEDNGAGVTTCTSFTILGPDGLPTIVESTYFATPTGAEGIPRLTNGFPWPVVTDGSISGLPSAVSGALPATWPAASATPPNNNGAGITTSTAFTILGADGFPTIVETSWVAPWPVKTEAGLPWGPQGPSDASLPGFPWPITPPFVVPTASPVNDGDAQTGPLTTCATFTLLGTDGVPTVVDSTWVVPWDQATQSNIPLPGTSNILPSNIAGQFTNAPGSPTQPIPGGFGASTTTCTSFTILGQDGLPTIVETTWLVPLPSATNIPLPTMVPQQSISGLPQGIPPTGDAITTSFTAISIGSDGFPTPVIQTIVLTPETLASAPPVTTAGLPNVPPFGPAVTSAGPQPSEIQGVPPLSEYGPLDPNHTPVLSDGALPLSGVLPPFITGTVTGTSTATLTMTTDPEAGDLGDSGAPSYGDPLSNDVIPGLPSELTLWPSSAAYSTPAQGASQGGSKLQTSTWTNLIAEQTTTYTMNYPLTTMAAVTPLLAVVGGKRLMRRQQGSFQSSLWTNSSMPATPLVSTPNSMPTPTGPSSSATTMCSAGGKIGNVTIDFDEIKSGPLYNPTNDFWFSGGFSIVPPSTQSFSYLPSSGGQLIEFVPPSLPASAGGSADTAEIGVGPNFANPFFRFNFYGASLGCAAEGAEQWCEFEVSAYAFDEASGGLQSIAWSETKRVPTCVDYPNGSCSLSPVEFEGYNNISSILITLHVGLDLRAWWADDLHVGWTDNSCDASESRSAATAYFTKRESRTSRLRRRLWNTLRLA